MKKLFTLIAILAINITLFSQAPQKLSYQAVIRNSSGGLVVSHAVGMKISILQGSATGTAVYVETHTITTNANGLATIEIGGGSVVSGAFTEINWGSGTYFIKTETDPSGGGTYTIKGTSQILSVPYALYSKTSGTLTLPYSSSISNASYAFSIGNSLASAISGVASSTTGINYGVYGESVSASGFGLYGKAPNIGIKGEATTGSGMSFGVYGKAVSTMGAAIFAEGGLYGIFGETSLSNGTAVLGQSSSATGTTYGIRGSVNSSSGFSGHFTGGKFHVSGRVGIGTTSPSSGLHLKGDGYPSSFMFLEANAAEDAGFRMYEGTTPKWHIFNDAGAGGLNIYNNAGKTAIFAKQSNSYVGIGTTTPSALLHVQGTGVGEGNVVFAGEEKETNPGNPPVSGPGTRMMWYPDKAAFRAGYASGIQWDKTNIGRFSIAMGIGTIASGYATTALGYFSQASGRLSTALGYSTIANAYSSTAIGRYNVGGGNSDSWVAADPLFEIGNGSSAEARSNAMTVLKNGNVGIGTTTPGYRLQVGVAGDGTQARANAWNNLSDARLKKDFTGLMDPLEMLEQINGFYFYWNAGTDNTRQIGFSAQEVLEVLPEVVSKGEDGYLSIEYGKMTPLLLEAIKELRIENEQLRTRLEKIERLINLGSE